MNLQEIDESTQLNQFFCYNSLEQKRALSLDKDTSQYSVGIRIDEYISASLRYTQPSLRFAPFGSKLVVELILISVSKILPLI